MTRDSNKLTLKSIKNACKEFEKENSFNGLYIFGNYQRQNLTNKQLAEIIVSNSICSRLTVSNTTTWKYSSGKDSGDILLHSTKSEWVDIDEDKCIEIEKTLSRFLPGFFITRRQESEKGVHVEEFFTKQMNNTWSSVHYMDESKAKIRKPIYEDRYCIASMLGVEYTEEFDMMFQKVLHTLYPNE